VWFTELGIFYIEDAFTDSFSGFSKAIDNKRYAIGFKDTNLLDLKSSSENIPLNKEKTFCVKLGTLS